MVKFPYENFWIKLILAFGLAACFIFSIITGTVTGFFTMFFNPAGGLLIGGIIILFGVALIISAILLISVRRKK